MDRTGWMNELVHRGWCQRGTSLARRQAVAQQQAEDFVLGIVVALGIPRHVIAARRSDHTAALSVTPERRSLPRPAVRQVAPSLR